MDSQAWDSETLAAWIVGGRDKIKRLGQRLIRQDEGVFEMLFSGSDDANPLDALAYYGRLSDIK